VSIKVRAKCEDKHLVQVQCWDLSGYYLLKELPPKWHWEVGEIGGIYDTGFVLSGLDPEVRDRIRDWWLAQPGVDKWDTPLLDRGETSSLEEGIKLAKHRHGLICELSLEPWKSYAENYGERSDG
jgi:hypothetical protein